MIFFGHHPIPLNLGPKWYNATVTKVLGTNVDNVFIHELEATWKRHIPELLSCSVDTSNVQNGWAAECYLQFLELQVYPVECLVPLRVYCRCVINVVWLGLVCCTRSIRTLITICSASCSSSIGVWVSRCRTSQFAWSFLPAQVRMWNNLPYIVFDTGTIDRFKGAVKRWLLPWAVFSFSVSQVLVGLR